MGVATVIDGSLVKAENPRGQEGHKNKCGPGDESPRHQDHDNGITVAHFVQSFHGWFPPEPRSADEAPPLIHCQQKKATGRIRRPPPTVGSLSPKPPPDELAGRASIAELFYLFITPGNGDLVTIW